MLNLLEHMYNYAESYTLILAWLVIPLVIGLCYLRFTRRINPPQSDSPEFAGVSTPAGEAAPPVTGEYAGETGHGVH